MPSPAHINPEMDMKVESTFANVSRQMHLLQECGCSTAENLGSYHSPPGMHLLVSSIFSEYELKLGTVVLMPPRYQADHLQYSIILTCC